MTRPPRVPLPDLSKGHAFPETAFNLSRDDTVSYLEAVGDANPLYLESGLAPPLAIAARALGALLDTIELPPGTLHTGQEVEAHTAVHIGAELALSGRIAQRSERAGLVISVLDFAVTAEGEDAPSLTGRTTVMAPAVGGAAGAA